MRVFGYAPTSSLARKFFLADGDVRRRRGLLREYLRQHRQSGNLRRPI